MNTNLDGMKSVIEDTDPSELKNVHPCMPEGREYVIDALQRIGVEVDDRFFIDPEAQTTALSEVDSQLAELENTETEIPAEILKFRNKAEKAVERNTRRREEVKELPLEEYLETLEKVDEPNLANHYAEMMSDILLEQHQDDISTVLKRIHPGLDLSNRATEKDLNLAKTAQTLYSEILARITVDDYIQESDEPSAIFKKLKVLHEVCSEAIYLNETQSSIFKEDLDAFIQKIFKEKIKPLTLEDCVGDKQGLEALLAIVALDEPFDINSFDWDEIIYPIVEFKEGLIAKVLERDKDVLLGESKGIEALGKIHDIFVILEKDRLEAETLALWTNDIFEQDHEEIFGDTQGLERFKRWSELIDQYPLANKGEFYENDMNQLLSEVDYDTFSKEADSNDVLKKIVIIGGALHQGKFEEHAESLKGIFIKLCEQTSVSELLEDSPNIPADKIEELQKLYLLLRSVVNILHIYPRPNFIVDLEGATLRYFKDNYDPPLTYVF